MNKHSATVDVTLSRRNLETIQTALIALRDNLKTKQSRFDEEKVHNHIVLCEQALDKITLGLISVLVKERSEK